MSGMDISFTYSQFYMTDALPDTQPTVSKH